MGAEYVRVTIHVYYFSFKMTKEEAHRTSLATNKTTEASYENNYDNGLVMQYGSYYIKGEENPRNCIRQGSRGCF